MPPRSIEMLPNRDRQDGAMLLDVHGNEIAPSEVSGRNVHAKYGCCTDCHWCLMLLLGLACSGALAGIGFRYGNKDVLDRMVSGRDFKGRLCGRDAGVEDFKYAYFTLQLGAANVGGSNWSAKTRSDLKIVCTNKCPEVNATAAKMQAVSARSPSACAADMLPNWCTWYGGETLQLMHYCIDPEVFIEAGTPIGQWIEDIRSSMYHLAIVLPVGIFMGFLFLTVLEKCGAVCVFIVLVLMAVIPAGLGIWVFHDAGHADTGITGQVKSLANLTPEHQKWVAYGLWGISALVLLLSCCFAGTVRGIAAVMKCTSQFLKEVPSQMLQPIMFGFLHLVVIAAWLVVFIEVASINMKEGDQQECLEVGDIYCLKVDENQARWFLLFLLVMIYWVLNFLHACSHFGTSFAVGAWYFTRPDPLNGNKKVPIEGGITCCDFTLSAKAVAYGLRHHAGSLSYGAFCISLAKVCKLLTMWATKKEEEGDLNGAVRCCLRCVNCLAECFTRFIQFVSEHAYVEMALNGTNFCTSCKKGMALAVTEPGMFSLVGRVASVVWLMGITIVTVSSTYAVALSLAWFKPTGLDDMSAPLVVAALCALCLGEVMMHPFTAAARASLHCYCLDANAHMGAEFTQQPMQQIIDEHRSHNENSQRSCVGRCCPCF